MMTSWNGNICRVTGHLGGSRWIPHTKVSDAELCFLWFASGICINGWVNNREAGDLRHYRTHYDVTVMFYDGGSHRTMCVWIFSKETRMLFDITSVTQTRLPAMFYNLLGVLWRIDICWNNTCTLPVSGVLIIMVLLETCFIWEFIFIKCETEHLPDHGRMIDLVIIYVRLIQFSTQKILKAIPLLEMLTCKSNINEICYIHAFESCRVLLFVECKIVHCRV